ncbi:MAG: hypothetical protein K5829_01830 [Treponema sp.]|nr:hypothetical protein [Treponema sp.]
MKKIILLLSTLPSLFAFSCKSIPLNKTELSPMAIMSLYGNTSLSLYEDTTNQSDGNYKIKANEEGFLTSLLNNTLDKDNIEKASAEERINSAEKIFKSMLQQEGIEIIEKEKVSSTNGYKIAKSNFLTIMQNTKAAEGYDLLKSVKSKLNHTVLQETGASSLVYAAFKFQKTYLFSGYKKLGMTPRVEMTIFLLDSNNKIILDKSYVGTSEKYAALYDNNYSKEELCSYYNEAIEDAVRQFLNDFQ